MAVKNWQCTGTGTRAQTGGYSTGCMWAQLNYGSPQTESWVFGILSPGPAKLGFNRAIGLIRGFEPSGRARMKAAILEYHGRGPWCGPIAAGVTSTLYRDRGNLYDLYALYTGTNLSTKYW